MTSHGAISSKASRNSPQGRQAPLKAGQSRQMGRGGGGVQPATAADYEKDGDFYFVRKSKRVKIKETQPSVAITQSSSSLLPKPKIGRPSAAAAAVGKKDDVVKEVDSTEEKVQRTRSSTRKRHLSDVSITNEEPPLKIAKGTTKSARMRRTTQASPEDESEHSPAEDSTEATACAASVPEPATRSRTNRKPRTNGRTTAPAAVAKKDYVVKEMNSTEENVRRTRSSTRKRHLSDASIINEEPPLKIAKGIKKSARMRRTSQASSEDELEHSPAEDSTEATACAASVPEPATRSRTNRKPRTNGRTTAPANGAPPPLPPLSSSPLPMQIPAIPDSPVHKTSIGSSNITLHISDTPIINRNQEMRKQGGTSNRRSSLGSRGRRASSLIESGQTAIPHREVDPSEFFKHIAAEGLPEPRRMKQLLMWCGERALAAKPQHGNPNSSAILGARAIQDQLLKDFASKSECSDWFSREDDIPQAPIILQPNPRNLELDEKKKALEARIKRLQEEKKSWLAIRKPPPKEPPLFTPEDAEKIILPEFDLLDLDDGKIRGYLADEANSSSALRSKTEARLRRIRSSLEFEVDQLVDNVHKLEQRVKVAGREADKVLALSSMRLKEREDRERQSAGTKDMPIMETLRSLSRSLAEDGKKL